MGCRPVTRATPLEGQPHSQLRARRAYSIPAKGDTKLKRLLLIEDDADLAAMYTLGLQGQGFVVTHVTTITDAAREAAEHIPELAVIDIGLPDGSGLDLLSEFRVKPGIPPLVAIVFTNFSDPDLKHTASERGAAAYMVKAETTPARLVAILKELAPD